MNRKEKIIPEMVESIEKTEPQTKGSVDLDQETLAFLRKHIDINIYPPEVELKKIKDLVKILPPESQSSARRALINKFKERLKETRKKTAKAQVEIENLIRRNPDISRKELMSQLNQVIFSNQLDPQRLEFIIAVDKFLDARDKVLGIIKRYLSEFGEGWQEKLFRDLFGGLPKGKIIVEILPASVYIRIFDIKDYVFAYVSITGGTEKSARSSGGAKFNYEFKNLPELNQKVRIE